MTQKRGTCRVSANASFVHNKLSFPSRQGQVTVFIIIGILILFIFAGVLYLTQSVTKETIEAEGEPSIATIPSEFKPVQLFTEDCIRQISKRGLIILGQQGGYIYPDIVGKYSSTNPVEADGINLEPVKVPYWHYNAESNEANKVVYASLKPKLYAKDDSEMSIEAQLSRYVEENLGNCLNNYVGFTEEGFEIDANMDSKTVEAKVGETTVNFLLTMEVNAKKGEAEASMKRFFIKIPLNLKHYYEVAGLIADTQSKKLFLERHGLELLSAYSRVDANYFPPISGITFEYFSPLSWDEFSLQQKYKEILASYVPMLRFLGSRNFYYSTEGRSFFAQKIIDNMIIPLLGAEDLDISFDYFGWEPYFKTNSEDGVIKPEHIFVNAWLLSYGQQRYETHYDISYPVLVTLSDEEALDGLGYQFLFSLESNIRNNRPAVSEQVRESYPTRISSLACNDNQKNSEMLKTIVVDSFSKESLEGVKIGFTIPEQAECEIGMTNKEGAVESKFPAVYGGVINFIYQDYLTSFYPIDTYKYRDKPAMIGYAISESEPAEKVVELYRIKKINVSVEKKSVKKCVGVLDVSDSESYEKLDEKDAEEAAEKKEYYKQAKRTCFLNQGQNLLLGDPVAQLVATMSLSKFHDYYFVNKKENLKDNEMATVILERVGGFHNEVQGQEFFASFSLTGKEVSEVSLVPGRYKMTIISTANEELVIPADNRCVGGDCFPFDQSVQKEYITGNVKWSTPETYVVITPEDLYTSNELTFFALSQDIYSVPEYLDVKDDDGHNIPARVIEDLQIPGNLLNLSQKPDIREALQPEFKLIVAGETE